MNTKKLLIGILFLSAILTVVYFQQTGQINPDELAEYIRGQGDMGLFVFILIYILGTLIAFPGAILSLTAGFLFNSLTGFIVVIIGASIGSLLSFFTARYLFHDYFHTKFGHAKFLKWTKSENQKRLTGTVLLMRLLPIFPFNAINYGIGLTKINAKNYFFATFFGIMPGTFLYVFLGSSLNDVFSAKFAIALVLLILFSVILGKIAKKTKFKQSGEVDIPIDGHELIVKGDDLQYHPTEKKDK